jgi:hypothetical protein
MQENPRWAIAVGSLLTAVVFFALGFVFVWGSPERMAAHVAGAIFFGLWMGFFMWRRNVRGGAAR